MVRPCQSFNVAICINYINWPVLDPRWCDVVTLCSVVHLLLFSILVLHFGPNFLAVYFLLTAEWPFHTSPAGPCTQLM